MTDRMTLAPTSADLAQNSDYQHLLGRISTTYTTGQLRASSLSDTEFLNLPP